jgi:Predicted CoA-binding protein
MTGKTLIIGASNNPERYSYKAAERLLAHGYEIEMIGKFLGARLIPKRKILKILIL